MQIPDKTTGVLKRAHNIAGRTFVVIDDSLVTHFSINEENTFFIQEATRDGILLRVYKKNGKQHKMLE